MICTACKRNPLIDNQTAALSVNIDDTLTLSWHTNGACCQPCADRLHALADQLGLVLDAFCSGLRDGDERPILRRVFERDDMREMLAAVVDALASRRSVTIPDQEAAAILRGAARLIRSGIVEEVAP